MLVKIYQYSVSLHLRLIKGRLDVCIGRTSIKKIKTLHLITIFNSLKNEKNITIPTNRTRRRKLNQNLNNHCNNPCQWWFNASMVVRRTTYLCHSWLITNKSHQERNNVASMVVLLIEHKPPHPWPKSSSWNDNYLYQYKATRMTTNQWLQWRWLQQKVLT